MPPSIARKADFFVWLRLVLRNLFMCHGCGVDAMAFAFATEAAEATDDHDSYQDSHHSVLQIHRDSSICTEGFALIHTQCPVTMSMPPRAATAISAAISK